MEIILHHFYRDREGKRWKVIETTGQKLFPVTGARWENKRYLTRCFRADGTYFGKVKEDPWDLVKHEN